MSVLIKGAKPPSGCRWCYFNEDSKCALIVACNFDDTNGTQRRKDCPLIELPNHGDLIDKTDLMASLGDWQLSEAPEEGQNWWLWKNVTSHELQYSIYRLLGDVYEEVRDAPVVIPAERSEE